MKSVKYIAQIAAGAVMAVLVMLWQGLDDAQTAADRLKIISDGFAVSGLLYTAMGVLIWVSTTGFFDIFAYAIRKGAHVLIPGMVKDDHTGYYEYQQGKKEARAKGETAGRKSTLFVGLLFFALSLLFTLLWYYWN